MANPAGGSADLREARRNSAHIESGVDLFVLAGGGLSSKATGPNSGPRRAVTTAHSAEVSHQSETVALWRLPAEVIATLHILVEIELLRLEGPVPKARPSLDVLPLARDHAVVK